MMFTLLPQPKAWVNTLVLAGLGVLATVNMGHAADRDSIINADAVMVSVDDNSDHISQVGFFDEVWNGGSSCDSACDSCGKTKACCCCLPWWAHRCGVFGEYMLLRVGNTDQIYDIEQNTVDPGIDPTGPVGRTNLDEESAYRVGASWAATCFTSLVGSYTRYEGNTANAIAATPGNFLNSQILHPNSIVTGSTSQASAAFYSMDFDQYDLGYRHIWKTSDIYALNWLAGFRYARMDQDFLYQQLDGVAIGLQQNDVDVDFSGFGMSLGLDGERRSCHTGLRIYGKAAGSLLAGNWKASYLQRNVQAGGGIIANRYEDYRVTPVLELELGLGWQSCCGRFRATTGYMTSAWYDAISTREYIEAVRATSYTDVDETITFNGLTARVEVRL